MGTMRTEVKLCWRNVGIFSYKDFLLWFWCCFHVDIGHWGKIPNFVNQPTYHWLIILSVPL